MILKRHISFKLRPYGTKRLVYQIQMHVTYDSGRDMLSTGCQVTSQEAWDADNQLVVPALGAIAYGLSTGDSVRI